jgi:hypothetical protein
MSSSLERFSDSKKLALDACPTLERLREHRLGQCSCEFKKTRAGRCFHADILARFARRDENALKQNRCRRGAIHCALFASSEGVMNHAPTVADLIARQPEDRCKPAGLSNRYF